MIKYGYNSKRNEKIAHKLWKAKLTLRFVKNKIRLQTALSSSSTDTVLI